MAFARLSRLLMNGFSGSWTTARRRYKSSHHCKVCVGHDAPLHELITGRLALFWRASLITRPDASFSTTRSAILALISMGIPGVRLPVLPHRTLYLLPNYEPLARFQWWACNLQYERFEV